ncbi:MAG: spermidine synthase [Planctomycetota bacterium]
MKKWILLHLMICGMCTIAVEVAAFRLLAPSFGSTQFITTNVLGVVLAALAAGYWIGGKLADRKPKEELLYTVSFAAAVLVVLLPFAAGPVLEAARPAISNQNATLFVGTLASMAGLFALPMLLLGMVSPFTIRLLANGDERAGSRGGLVFALSTIGSIFGAYLPALVTIPWIGTRGTIQLFGGIVLFISAIGLFLCNRRAAGSVALLLTLVPAVFVINPIRPAKARNVIEERETEYYVARVVRDERYQRTLLEMNEGLSYHSMEYDDGRLSPGVWGFFQIFPRMIENPQKLQKPPLRICIIGLAAGTIATQLKRAYESEYSLTIDGVEIDREIVELGRKYFRLDDRLINIKIEDGRTFLARTPEKYDLIFGDAYRQPYLPPHLVTKEFFAIVKERLNPGGICSINIGAVGTQSLVLRGIQNAMIEAFGPGAFVERFEVTNSDVPFSNFVCMASDRPLRARFASVADPQLINHRNVALEKWQLLQKDPQAPVFTDDRCPVEWYTDLSLLQMAAR